VLTEATAAIQQQKYLTLTCAKCTRTGMFRGATRNDAIDKAVAQGWKSRGRTRPDGRLEAIELCKKCH
jgi:hypothetical protein